VAPSKSARRHKVPERGHATAGRDGLTVPFPLATEMRDGIVLRCSFLDAGFKGSREHGRMLPLPELHTSC
jgi:hypothetical protein